jgi:hypothetical protein
MNRKLAVWTVGLAVTIPLTGCFEVDQPVAGSRISVTSFADNPSHNRVVFLSNDATTLTVPEPQSAGDPTMNGGVITLQNPETGAFDSFTLPAKNWTMLHNPAGGYRYVDAMQHDGPCQYVSVTTGDRLVATCRGADLQYPMTEKQGMVSINVILGTVGGTRYCAEFGGHVMRDDPCTPDQPGSFLAMNAPAPTACDGQ